MTTKLWKADLVKRLRSAARHDGLEFPAGGEAPTMHLVKLLREAANEIVRLRQHSGGLTGPVLD